MPQMIIPLGHFHVQQAVTRLGGIRPEQEDPFSTATPFEEDLWQEYGFIGEVDPEHLLKECQRRVGEAEDETPQKFKMRNLLALSTIHKMRKKFSDGFVSQEVVRPEAEEALPHDQSKPIDKNFWAVLIGNNRYTSGGELYGVPKDRVRLLHNASRATILDALYDLRDNPHIQFGDNILVHFSGHGSSYDAESFFESADGSAGSIEAICPSDRSGDFIADCCYSGGMMRANLITEEVLNHRFLTPIQLGPMSMLKAAEGHPRRKSSVLASSDNWKGDLSSFVQLGVGERFEINKKSGQDIYQCCPDAWSTG